MRPLDTRIEALITLVNSGDRLAHQRLFDVLYADLHRLARRELSRRGAGVSLGITTLLHEAYLDISQRERVSFPDQARFMAYAAKAMRSLIIDYARGRQAQKRGGGFEITSLDTSIAGHAADEQELSQLGEALDELGAAEPALAQLVDLKFFCGFSFKEIAAMRGVSERTVRRDWERARIYLHHTLQDVSPLT